MRAIELLGPSGVGKTFLYKRLFETYTERRYMNVSEACINAATNLRFGLEFTRYHVYSLLLKSGLFGFKAYGLSRKLLLRDKGVLSSANGYRLSFELLKKELSRTALLTEKNPAVFSRRMENLTCCAQLDQALEKYLNKDQVVLFDEGMLHHHHGLTSAVTSQYTADDISADRMLNPAAVISCELSFDTLMHRILKRRSEGIETFSHSGLSEAELSVYVRKHIDAYRQKIEALGLLGIPVLVIQTDTSVSANLSTVHSFINNLISS